MIVLAVENSIANLEKLEACIQYNLPYAQIHGFVNGASAMEWAETHPVDIVFAQYNPEDEVADGAEGAVAAKQLYADGKCKNIILCADSISFSMSAWNSDASFFYLKPVSNKKIWMGLEKLRYPISPGRMMYGKGGIENHLTKEDKEFPKKYIFEEEDEFM